MGYDVLRVRGVEMKDGGREALVGADHPLRQAIGPTDMGMMPSMRKIWWRKPVGEEKTSIVKRAHDFAARVAPQKSAKRKKKKLALRTKRLENTEQSVGKLLLARSIVSDFGLGSSIETEIWES